tara:strand:- start:560 stop:1153 length:594 start_codon:yes stop_codon:yes gene_type:complete
MALIVGGTTVTGTQVLDATKLSGNLPALNASSLTDIPAISTTPTTGTWTISTTGTNPSTCGSVDNVTGKYMKFGKYVHCQVQFQTASLPDASGSYRLALWYMTGLPFTSYNFGTTWFAGIGRPAVGGRAVSSAPSHILIPSNSTNMIFHLTNAGNNSQTSEYLTPDSGPAYRQHDGNGMLNANDKWHYFEFTYIANS